MAVEAPAPPKVASKRTIALRRRKLATDHLHPVNQIHIDEATLGERLADRVATVIGSWPFLIVQTILIVLWVVVNAVELFVHPWDPFPFILLNLCFSLQAENTRPVLLVSRYQQ